jgi:ribonuclease D
MPELPEITVDSADAFAAMCEHVAAFEVFGFDTEFIGEDSYRPELCLLQVATDERLFVVDPFACGPLDAFWELVADPQRTAVVHAGREEIRICHFQGGRPPGDLFDLQLAAGLIGLSYPIGHGTLISQMLGVRLPKGETLTDWRLRPLTPRQVRYAFDDVRFLLPLHRKITKRLTDLGRAEWADEENASLVRRAVLENPALEKWRKLRGAGALDRRRLAILRELYAWREDIAARTNRPTRFILRDDLVVEVARRNPKSLSDLEALRGLPRLDPGPLFEAIERGRAVPAEECPEAFEREDDPPQVAVAGAVLSACLGDICQRNYLASSLVTTASELRSLVRLRSMGGDVSKVGPLAGGWRGRAVLPRLLDLLDGRVGVHIADLARESPLGYEPRGGG